jgi:hypothetical protein
MNVTIRRAVPEDAHCDREVISDLSAYGRCDCSDGSSGAIVSANK